MISKKLQILSLQPQISKVFLEQFFLTVFRTISVTKYHFLWKFHYFWWVWISFWMIVWGFRMELKISVANHATCGKIYGFFHFFVNDYCFFFWPWCSLGKFLTMSTKVGLLNWYSPMSFFFRKIRIIFDVENWFWKLDFGTFWRLFLAI